MNNGWMSQYANMAKYKVFGIDVSLYQRDLKREHWPILEELGAKFAFIKASQCFSSVDIVYGDPLFKAHRDNSARTNILRGPYHFFIPDRDARTQADYFCDLVGGKHYRELWQLPPAVDVELIGQTVGVVLGAKLKLFLDVLEDKLGNQPIIYTNKNVWNTTVYSKKVLWMRTGVEWAKKYVLWAANYNTSKPAIPSDWDEAAWNRSGFWQYRCDGYFPSIPNIHFDLNVFNGELGPLLKLCNFCNAPTGSIDPDADDDDDDPTPKPIPYVPGPADGVIVAPTVTVRPKPKADSKALATLYKGNSVTAYEQRNDNQGDNWWRISAPGQPSGWIRAVFHGITLAKLV